MFLVRRKDCKNGEVLAPFPANYFFKKIDLKIIFLLTADTGIFEIVFSSMGSPNLQLKVIRLNYYGNV